MCSALPFRRRDFYGEAEAFTHARIENDGGRSVFELGSGTAAEDDVAGIGGAVCRVDDELWIEVGDRDFGQGVVLESRAREDASRDG